MLICVDVKSQSPCEKRFDKLVADVNAAQTIKDFENVKSYATNEINYISINCPAYWAQNQEKLNKARAGFAERYKRLSESGMKNQNPISGPQNAASCTAITQSTPQPSAIIIQYKDNPIEYSNTTKNTPTAFSHLIEEDKKKLMQNIENNKIDQFDEKNIDKLLDIKDDIMSKPIFDTRYYSNFSEAIYKTAEEAESSIMLEDVAGYSFDITFTVKKTGFFENIRFSNGTGIGATPKINQSLKTIIYTLGAKSLWLPAKKNDAAIDDDVTVEIDVDRYLKAYYKQKKLKEDLAAIKTSTRKPEIIKNNADFVVVPETQKESVKEYFRKLFGDAIQPFTEAKKKYDETIGKNIKEVKALFDPTKSLGETSTTNETVEEPDGKEEYTYIGGSLYRVYRINSKQSRLVPVE